MSNINFQVITVCSTYNHAKYIEDAMNGFCFQQTNFPFVCVIIDDASTDGEQDVINNYLTEHFDVNNQLFVREDDTNDYKMFFARHKTNYNCYFAVYFLKYNHYSIRKSTISYYKEWLDKAKYRALCEGDDFWIDNVKLQKQFDYIDSHPNCTMVCNRAKLYSEKNKKYVGEQYCRNSNGELSPIDVINRTGLYIPTCSTLYVPEIRDNFPKYCHNCNVGDYPIQIIAAMKGYVYYFDNVMSVYRIDCPGSWSNRQKFNSVDPNRLHIVKGQVEMFKGFMIDNPMYKDVFNEKIAEHICKNMPSWNVSRADKKKYKDFFSIEISTFKLKWKFLSVLVSLPIPMKKLLYLFFFNKKYVPMYMYY